MSDREKIKKLYKNESIEKGEELPNNDINEDSLPENNYTNEEINKFIQEYKKILGGNNNCGRCL